MSPSEKLFVIHLSLVVLPTIESHHAINRCSPAALDFRIDASTRREAFTQSSYTNRNGNGNGKEKTKTRILRASPSVT